MRIKDTLCQKALELENEIEFLKSIKKPTKKQQATLKKIYTLLKNLREGSKQAWYDARIFLNASKDEMEKEMEEAP